MIFFIILISDMPNEESNITDSLRDECLKRFFCVQEHSYCTPKNEDCVKRQPLKDKSCLVPCTGLYADVPSDYKQDTEALEQNVIKGNLCFREDPCLKTILT